METSVVGDGADSRASPRFRLLGSVAVDGNGGGPPQERALLAILLLHPGHVVTTDSLIDALWGDSPPPSAVHAIQVHVSEIRRKIGSSCIETTPTGYRAAVDPEEIDWCRFERAVRYAETVDDPSIKRRLLADALLMWSGEPLDDLTDLLACDVGQRRLLEMQLLAVESWARASLEVGETARLIPELTSLAIEHPLHEPLWECLMEALDGAGRQPEALHAYALLRENLAEVGLEPTARLQATEARILLADAGESPPSRRTPRWVGVPFVAALVVIVVAAALVLWWPTRSPAYVVLDPWTAERHPLDLVALQDAMGELSVDLVFLDQATLSTERLCGDGALAILAGPSTHDAVDPAACAGTRLVALDVEPAVADVLAEESTVTPVVLATEEAGFLVGAVAALESRTGTIGFVGGTPIPAVDRFLAGFEAGATRADPAIIVVATYLSEDTTPAGFGEAFDNPELGSVAARVLFDADADVVFHAAGGSGEGVLDAIVEESSPDRPLRFIGVDLDARALASSSQQPYVLTSAVTRLDEAIRAIVELDIAGALDGSPILLGLSDGAVRVASGGAAIASHTSTIEGLTTLINGGYISVPTVPSDRIVVVGLPAIDG